MEHRIRVDGLTPLLQSNGAQVLLPKVPRQKAVKAELDPVAAAALAVYKTRKGEFGHPVSAFRSAFVTAAKKYPALKGMGNASGALAGALDIEPADLAVLTDKRGAPLKSYETDVRVVVNHHAGGARIPSAKPRFDDWHCFLTLDVDETVWPATKELEELLFEIIRYAGRAVGVGSGRPENKKLSFGRFEVARLK